MPNFYPFDFSLSISLLSSSTTPHYCWHQIHTLVGSRTVARSYWLGLLRSIVSTLTNELNQLRYVLSSQIWVDFSLFNVFLYSDMSLFLSMSLFCHHERLIVQLMYFVCVWVYRVHFKKSSFVILIESWLLNLKKEMVR